MRKGEHETKVYFVKQLRVRAAEGEDDERLVPMLREYTVFNVAQCEGLPASIIDGKPARVRNPDTRDRRARRAARPLSKQTSEKTNNIAWRAPGGTDHVREFVLNLYLLESSNQLTTDGSQRL